MRGSVRGAPGNGRPYRDCFISRLSAAPTLQTSSAPDAYPWQAPEPRSRHAEVRYRHRRVDRERYGRLRRVVLVQQRYDVLRLDPALTLVR
jgi:hypothetical protein